MAAIIEKVLHNNRGSDFFYKTPEDGAKLLRKYMNGRSIMIKASSSLIVNAETGEYPIYDTSENINISQREAFRLVKSLFRECYQEKGFFMRMTVYENIIFI